VLSRIAAVLGGLESNSGCLRTTIHYSRLESTERAWNTYSLGMTMARWIAASQFGVAWLQHLAHAPWPIRFVGRQRPDLVGTNPSGWCIIEAKGRQRGSLRRPLQNGKNQVLSVRTVAGSSPTLSLSIATKFTRSGVRAIALDPESTGTDDIELSEGQFLRWYYRDILQLLLEAPRLLEQVPRQPGEYVSVFLPIANLWLGIRRWLYEALRDDRPLSFERFLVDGEDVLAGMDDGSFGDSRFFGGWDGVAVGFEAF
jgi:hypothetical protein